MDVLDGDRQAAIYWRNIFDRVYRDQIDSWAYRWTLACWAQAGLTVLPNTNLVENIGFGEGATHTKDKKKTGSWPLQALEFPLRHPPFIIRDRQADHYTQATHFRISFEKRLKRWLVNTFMRWDKIG